MSLNRRQLLNRGGAASAGVLAASFGLGSPALADAARTSRAPRAARGGSSGPCSRSRATCSRCPPGFSYEAVAVSGETDVHDGTGTVVGKTPERPDGTLVVALRDRLPAGPEPRGLPGCEAPGAAGRGHDVRRGRPRRRLHRHRRHPQRQRRSEWVGLSGTISNCAGGPTPWGSWLTCEESEAKAGTGGCSEGPRLRLRGLRRPARPSRSRCRSRPGAASPTRPSSSSRAAPAPTSPRTPSGPNGLFYRWTAPTGYRLRPRIAEALGAEDGTLEALAVLDRDGSVLPDLAYVTSAQIGQPVPDHRGRRCPTGRPRPPRSASSSPTARSPAPRSSRVPGATSTAPTSWPASRSAPSDLPADATKHDGQLWYYRYADQTLTLRRTSPTTRPARRDPRLGGRPRAQHRPGLRRPRRLPRVALRQPGAQRGRQHREPPALLVARRPARRRSPATCSCSSRAPPAATSTAR